MKDKIKLFVFILLLVTLLVLLARKIDLTTADLGRHLKNGEIIASLDGRTINDVLKTNFYSYTNPDFPFVNHHWGSGVLFFLVWKLGGFKTLSVFFIGLYLISFTIFFSIAKNYSGFWRSILASIILLPLIADRNEVRPEIFSYLFSAIFLWILMEYKEKRLSYKYLFALPIIELVWINLHVYFFVGIFLFGLFIFCEIISKFREREEEVKKILIAFFLTCAAALFNPFGIRGLLYPLNIFKNYGYLIVENQSIRFLEKINFQNPNFIVFKLVFAIIAASFILVFLFNRRKFSIFYLVCAATFSIMTLAAIRNFTLLGLFALPIIAYNLKNIPKITLESASSLKNFLGISLCAIITLCITVNVYQAVQYFNADTAGIGLVKDNASSVDFFKQKNIQGPIFNNYDIGSFLILYLYPSQKVFVDNRPEAYPNQFFKETYIPMEENDAIWKKQDEKNSFNAIFFSYRDYTPWGQNFLKERLSDPEWAPVFADNYAIILLKRNEQNESIIEKNELPKETFRFTAS